MRISVVFLLVAALLAGGCVTKVGFGPHAPYASERVVRRELLVVLPSDIDERFEKATFGPALEPMHFRVFYGQALRHEMEARYRTTFSEVATVTKLEHDIALELPLDPPDAADEKAYEAWEKRYEAARKGTEFLPTLVEEQRGYLLTVEEAKFSLEGRTPILVVDVTLADRETGEQLFDGPMRARATGPTIPDRTARGHQEKVVREATLATTTELLRNLSDDIFEALDANAASSRK